MRLLGPPGEYPLKVYIEDRDDNVKAEYDRVITTQAWNEFGTTTYDG